MPEDLITGAREQAEQSDPPVRAAALMRIARVQTAFNGEQARQTFRKALAEARLLPGHDGEILLEQARLLAAAMAPDLLSEIPAGPREPRHFWSDALGRIMLDHGHVDAAYEYLLSYDDPSTFPFGLVPALMQLPGNEARNLTAFRRAIEAWRAAPENRFAHTFIALFQLKWNMLPPEESLELAREIVRVTLSRPDNPITANYDQERSVTITSGREHTLFTILHILRRLDPPLAESLVAKHEQLAAAVRRFPNGMDSVIEEAEQRRRSTSSGSASGGFGMAGSPRDFPYMQALMQGAQDGDLSPAMEHALGQYAEDTAPERPNRAPREFWPSTCRFRSILYRAGKCLGPEGAVYLDRIPDDDLRLFARIEFAAALAGLPELQGTQREQRHDPPPVRRGPALSGVRCPQCDWTPGAEDRWSCTCRHVWNTFETGGVCPACRYKWEVTVCHGCHKMSPHAAWYLRK